MRRMRVASCKPWKSNEAISNPSQDNIYAKDRKDEKNQHFRKKAIAVPSGCNLADLKTELDERQSTLPGITAFFLKCPVLRGLSDL